MHTVEDDAHTLPCGDEGGNTDEERDYGDDSPCSAGFGNGNEDADDDTYEE